MRDKILQRNDEKRKEILKGCIGGKGMGEAHHETHYANGKQVRMVIIWDVVARSKDSAQRKDLKFESGALLSSDKSSCLGG